MTKRIFAALVGITTVAVVLFAVPLGAVVARTDRSNRVLVLQREATSNAVLVPDDRRQNQPITLGAAPASGHLGFYAPGADLAAGTGPARADGVTAAALAGTSGDADVGDEIVAAVPVSDDQRVIGAVRIAEPATVVLDQVHTAWLELAVLGLGIIVAAAVLALVLARRLAAPWRSLEHRAGRLGDGDFATMSEPTGIDEVDRANDALDETSARLASMIERERQFSADASHELRTPLTGLKVILESELARPRPDATLALESALQQVDRLDATIDSLLAAARDDPRQRHPLDLGALLRDAADRWSAEAAADGRVVHLELDPDALQPVASATVIVHVVDVLVANALRHGRGDVRLVLRDVAGGGVAVEVTDHGGPIVDTTNLFKRRSGTASGHGIGLALARTLAVAEGGVLDLAENAADRTTFELLLAVPDPGRTDAGGPAEPDPPPPSGDATTSGPARFAER